jgi:hypothetical protein
MCLATDGDPRAFGLLRPKLLNLHTYQLISFRRHTDLPLPGRPDEARSGGQRGQRQEGGYVGLVVLGRSPEWRLAPPAARTDIAVTRYVH